MGLDMYLDKAKRIDGATIKEIRVVEEYYEYISEPKAKEYTMKEWCDIDESEVNKGLVDLYKDEYVERYSAWDTDKTWPYKCIWQNVAYWRKANQIHNWFVVNVQNGVDDCGSYEVTKKQLSRLLGACKEVKANSTLVNGEYIEDPSAAMDLLPTTAGFFFGSTGYDQWYMENIDETIKILTEVLSNTDFETEVVVYSASW